MVGKACGAPSVPLDSTEKLCQGTQSDEFHAALAATMAAGGTISYYFYVFGSLNTCGEAAFGSSNRGLMLLFVCVGGFGEDLAPIGPGLALKQELKTFKHAAQRCIEEYFVTSNAEEAEL